MAGDWSKIEHCTPDKPEIMRIAAILKCSIGDAFLGCFRVWRWADQQSYEGNAPGVTPALLNSQAGVTGFAEAMAAVGWLDVTADGISIPEFDRHTSESAKTRALAAKRAANHRNKSNAKSNAKSNGAGAISALPREEKSINTPLPPQSGGDGAAEFAQFWKAYPSKKSKPDAIKAWKKLKPDAATLGAILAALDPSRWPARWSDDNGRYIPHPSTWLNNRRWEDQEPSINPRDSPPPESDHDRDSRIRREREEEAAAAARFKANGPVRIGDYIKDKPR